MRSFFRLPGGGGSKARKINLARTCAPLIQGFFSRSRRFRAGISERRKWTLEKTESFQGASMWRYARSSSESLFIFWLHGGRGGGQNSGAFRSGTGRLPTQTCSRVWEEIFSDAALGKIVAKLGGGGSVACESNR